MVTHMDLVDTGHYFNSKLLSMESPMPRELASHLPESNMNRQCFKIHFAI